MKFSQCIVYDDQGYEYKSQNDETESQDENEKACHGSLHGRSKEGFNSLEETFECKRAHASDGTHVHSENLRDEGYDHETERK